MTTTPAQFQTEWESYWHDTSAGEDTGSIWEADPTHAAAKDLPRFQSLVDSSLPLVDLGCGSGLQTRFLAQHFPRVIGADVSASAVALASRTNAAPNVQYRVLDVFDSKALKAFHDEMGDVNIYMRTLLHLVQPESRTAFGEAVATLLGSKGTLYLLELGAKAGEYFGAWIQRNGMPVRLARVLKTGIKPGTVNREHVLSAFPPERFNVVADGDVVSDPVQMQVLGPTPGPAKEPWAPPSYFMVLQPRKR